MTIVREDNLLKSLMTLKKAVMMHGKEISIIINLQARALLQRATGVRCVVLREEIKQYMKCNNRDNRILIVIRTGWKRISDPETAQKAKQKVSSTHPNEMLTDIIDWTFIDYFRICKKYSVRYQGKSQALRWR